MTIKYLTLFCIALGSVYSLFATEQSRYVFDKEHDYKEALIPASVLDLELFRHELELNDLIRSYTLLNHPDPELRYLTKVYAIALHKPSLPKSIHVQICFKKGFLAQTDDEKRAQSEAILNFILRYLQKSVTNEIERFHLEGRILSYQEGNSNPLNPKVYGVIERGKVMKLPD